MRKILYGIAFLSTSLSAAQDSLTPHFGIPRFLISQCKEELAFFHTCHGAGSLEKQVDHVLRFIETEQPTLENTGQLIEIIDEARPYLSNGGHYEYFDSVQDSCLGHTIKVRDFFYQKTEQKANQVFLNLEKKGISDDQRYLTSMRLRGHRERVFLYGATTSLSVMGMLAAFYLPKISPQMTYVISVTCAIAALKMAFETRYRINDTYYEGTIEYKHNRNDLSECDHHDHQTVGQKNTKVLVDYFERIATLVQLYDINHPSKKKLSN